MVAHGLVQGVGFRWYTARRAEALGLAGFVRNTIDGTVEIEAEGERASLEDLIREIRVGPRSAQVTDLSIDWITPTHARTHFEIR